MNICNKEILLQKLIDNLDLPDSAYEKAIAKLSEELESARAQEQEIAELILDSNRNRILSLELRIGIVTLGFTMATFIAGLFGMNLVSGLEEHP